jgi:hypothetical protein
VLLMSLAAVDAAPGAAQHYLYWAAWGHREGSGRDYELGNSLVSGKCTRCGENGYPLCLRFTPHAP